MSGRTTAQTTGAAAGPGPESLSHDSATLPSTDKRAERIRNAEVQIAGTRQNIADLEEEINHARKFGVFALANLNGQTKGQEKELEGLRTLLEKQEERVAALGEGQLPKLDTSAYQQACLEAGAEYAAAAKRMDNAATAARWTRDGAVIAGAIVASGGVATGAIGVMGGASAAAAGSVTLTSAAGGVAAGTIVGGGIGAVSNSAQATTRMALGDSAAEAWRDAGTQTLKDVKTAAVVSAETVAFEVISSVWLQKGLKEGARQGMKIVMRDVGRNTTQRTVTERTMDAAVGRVEGIIKKKSIGEARRSFGRILSKPAKRIFRREMAELGSTETLEGFASQMMTRETTEVGVKGLQRELTEIGEDQVVSMLKTATNDAARSVPAGAYRKAAYKGIVRQTRRAGLTENEVAKQIVRRVSRYRKMPLEEGASLFQRFRWRVGLNVRGELRAISSELRSLSPELTEREAWRMAKGMRAFSRGKLGRAFGGKIERELAEDLHRGMLEGLEGKELREYMSSQVDDLARRYGLEDDVVVRLKGEINEAFDRFCGRYLRRLCRKAVRRGLEALRGKRKLPLFPFKFGREENVRAARRAAVIPGGGTPPTTPPVLPTDSLTREAGAVVRSRRPNGEGAALVALSGQAHSETHRSFLVAKGRLDGVQSEGDMASGVLNDYDHVLNRNPQTETAGRAPVADLDTRGSRSSGRDDLPNAAAEMTGAVEQSGRRSSRRNSSVVAAEIGAGAQAADAAATPGKVQHAVPSEVVVAEAPKKPVDNTAKKAA